MKKIGFILIIVMIALASCSKGDKADKAHPLVGTWVLTYTDWDILTEMDVIYNDEITFNSNNTGSALFKANGIAVETTTFTWGASNNILTVSYEGETETYPYVIGGNQLTLDGDVYIRK